MHPSPRAPSRISTFSLLALLAAFWAPGPAGGQPAPEGGASKKDSGPPPTFGELKAKFESELGKEAFERLSTIEAFGKIRSKESTEFLGGLYANEPNGAVGISVTRALGSIGTEDAAKALIQKGMPYFLEPSIPTGKGNNLGPEQVNSFKEERKTLLNSMEAALTGRLEPKAEEWLVRNALTPLVRKDEQALGVVLKAMAGFKAKSRLLVLLPELPKLASPATQVSVLDALREVPEKDEKIAGAALLLMKSTHLDVQTAAYDLLASFPGAKHRTQLISGLKHKSWEIRVICLDSLSTSGDKDIVKHAGLALKDPEPKVRLSAIGALFANGGPEAIEPLYKALETRDGRIQDDITDALTRLTGKSFGPIAAQWESWWSQAKATYKKSTPLTPEELAELKAQDAKKVTLAVPLYFGLRILSNRTAFLIDCSESMNEEYVPAQPFDHGDSGTATTVVKKPEGEDGGGAETTADPAKKPKTQRKQKGAASRLDVAKRELGEVLSKLNDGQFLNLFRFNSLITDFSATGLTEPTGSSDGKPKTMPRLDAKVRAAAKDFIAQSKAEGLTNLLSALRQALEYSDLDTIYLLSDGAPTVGVTNQDELLRELRRLNRRRKVKINAISFHPLPAERELLRSLAVQNHGVYVER